MPHGDEHHRHVGRPAVPSRDLGGVSQAGPADRAQGGASDPGGLWAGDGAPLLGQGYHEPLYWVRNMAQAEGSLALVGKALPY